mgnify:CR=1 FL=1
MEHANDTETTTSAGGLNFSPPEAIRQRGRRRLNVKMKRFPTVDIEEGDYWKLTELLQNEYGTVPNGAYAVFVRTILKEYLQQHGEKQAPQAVEVF